MIIGLVGGLASGKGTVFEYFKEKGFLGYTISHLISELMKENNISITRKAQQDFSNEMKRKYGAGLWAIKLIDKIDLEKDYIIDGIRNPGEIEEFKKLKNFHIISLDAPQKIRFERLIKRGDERDPKTWDDFFKLDNRDREEEDPMGQQVGKCINMADFHIENNSNLEELKRKIDEVFEKVKLKNNKN